MGNNGNISVSRISAKILNGVNKFNLKAWSGRSIDEAVPEMFIILDNN